MKQCIYEVLIRDCVGEESTVKTECRDPKTHETNKFNMRSLLAHSNSQIVRVLQDTVGDLPCK